MSLKSKTNPPEAAESSAFSEFIRNASSGEKKRVYSEVLKKASEKQKELLDRARSNKQ